MNAQVQIICVAHNCAEYITQTIRGILNQDTYFEYQLLITDDASTDETSAIIEEFSQKNPDKILHIKWDEPIGFGASLSKLYTMASAQYIAFCNGSDNWIDTYKLKKQIDILNAHPEIRACAHCCNVINTNFDVQNNMVICPSGCKYDTNLSAVNILFNCPKSSTLVIRKIEMILPEWFGQDTIDGDVSELLFLNLGTGKILILNTIMSNCHIHVAADTKSTLCSNVQLLKHFIHLRRLFTSQNQPVIVNKITSTLWSLITTILKQIEETNAWECLCGLHDNYPDGYAMIVALLNEYKFRIKSLSVLGTLKANLLFENEYVLKKLPSYIPLTFLQDLKDATGKPLLKFNFGHMIHAFKVPVGLCAITFIFFGYVLGWCNPEYLTDNGSFIPFTAIFNDSGLKYLAYLSIGCVFWGFFNTILTGSSPVTRINKNIITKFGFKTGWLISVTIAIQTLYYIPVIICFIVGAIIAGWHPGFCSIMQLIIAFSAIFLLAVGLTYPCALLFAKFKFDRIFNLLKYTLCVMSCVFIRQEMINLEIRQYCMWNPLIPPLNLARALLIGNVSGCANAFKILIIPTIVFAAGIITYKFFQKKEAK